MFYVQFFLVSPPCFQHGLVQRNHWYKSPQLLNVRLLHANIFVMMESLFQRMAQLSCYYFKLAAGNMKLFTEYCRILLYGLLKLVLMTKLLRLCCLCHKAFSASENILRRGTATFCCNQRVI